MNLDVNAYGSGQRPRLRTGVLRHGIAALAVASVAALSLAACSSSGSPKSSSISTVSIGSIQPTTGADASSGLDTQRGAQLAVQIINGSYPSIPLPFPHSKPGLPNLGGAKIKLISLDTQTSAQTAASDVSQLVTSDHVAGIVGEYASADTLTASAAANRLGVPFVNGASSARSLTQQGLTTFFRVGPSDYTFGQGLFAWLKSEAAAGKSVNKIAILHTNDTYGTGVDQVTRQLAAQAGYQVVADVSYDATSTTDLTPEVEQIKAADPDVLFDSSYTNDAVLLMRTLTSLNYHPDALLTYGAGFADPTFLPTVGSQAAGLVSRVSWSLDFPNAASRTVASMFQKEFGEPMTENSARNFTAMMTLAAAINAAGSTNPAKVTAALRKINIPGKDLIMPWPGVKFNADGQNVDATGVVEQVQGGKFVVVYPTSAAIAKPIWPMTAAEKP